MFELAELDSRVGKRDYELALPAIRTELLELQQQLESAAIPVVCLIAGVDGSGKGDLLHVLNEWLDPRYMQTHVFGAPSDEERERPPHWRYWMSLPFRGQIGLYVVGWYGPPMADRLYKRIGGARLVAELARINRLERALVDDGALVVKIWLHLSKAQQKKRLKRLESNPETRWRVTDIDRKHLKLYDSFIKVAERTLRETSTAEAPWLILNGYDSHYRRLAAARHLIDRFGGRLEREPHSTGPIAPPAAPIEPGQLKSLVHDVRLTKSGYRELKAGYQGRLSQAATANSRPVIRDA